MVRLDVAYTKVPLFITVDGTVAKLHCGIDGGTDLWHS